MPGGGCRHWWSAIDEVRGAPVTPDGADRHTCVACDASDSIEVSRAEVLLAELSVEPQARSPPPEPLEQHAGHRRRRQQYVSHEFLCHVRPVVSAREMTRRHRRCVRPVNRTPISQPAAGRPPGSRSATASRSWATARSRLPGWRLGPVPGNEQVLGLRPGGAAGGADCFAAGVTRQIAHHSKATRAVPRRARVVAAL
jgi:hypothetical protein